MNVKIQIPVLRQGHCVSTKNPGTLVRVNKATTCRMTETPALVRQCRLPVNILYFEPIFESASGD